MKKLILSLCLLFLFQSGNSQNQKFKKSAKEQSIKDKKKFDEYYDTVNHIYSNYRYNVGYKIPKKWIVDKGFSEHTILRTYAADSSNSFTINVIETEYNIEELFWKEYAKNGIEIEKKYKKMLENQLNTKINNYKIEKSYVKNFQSLKRKFEFTRKDQDFEYEVITTIQQVLKGHFTYTFSLSIPKMFYDLNPNHYDNLFLNVHFLVDKKKLDALIKSK